MTRHQGANLLSLRGTPGDPALASAAAEGGEARSEPKASEAHPARAARSRPDRSAGLDARPNDPGARTRIGFTLIELLAVIAMFALIAAMVVPNLDLGGSRAVRSAASDVATALEMARERAIMTGRVHAVVLDLDRGSYWIEWSKPLERPAEAAPQGDAAGGEHKLALVPPPIEGAELEPLFGVFGRPQPIEDPVVLLGVELDGGTADSGTVELRMDGDGATDPAAILLGEADGSHAVRIEVEPLADAVHVVNVE